MGTLFLLSGGEQNRLIQDHMGLVTAIAADYRGRKGIPFEDLVSEGMVGRVEAARRFSPEGGTKFWSWATHRIRGSILNFIEAWQEFVPLEEFNEQDLEDKIYEWKAWGNWGCALAEDWTNLASTPEDLLSLYQETAANQGAFAAAFTFLSRRERSLIHCRFLRDPHMTLEDIARDHKISYARTVELIDKSLKKMRESVRNHERRRT